MSTFDSAEANWLEPDDDPFECALEAGWINPDDLTKALVDVMNERDRQYNEEKFDYEHDDGHPPGEMARAAACYAYISALHDSNEGAVGSGHDFALETLRRMWPGWDPKWFKPTTSRRDLVKSCALALAEIERIDRAEKKDTAP